MRKILFLLALCCNAAVAAELEYRLSYIVTSDEKSAADIIRRLGKGEDFAQLAKKESIERVTAEGGGDAGWLPAKKFHDGVQALLKDMRSGQFSKAPMKIGGNWFVFRVNGIRNDGEDFMVSYSSWDEKKLESDRRQSEDNRTEIRSLRAQATVPPFANLPPVTAATASAPADSSVYNGAYQTKDGCVFFYERNATTTATHAQWSGPACKGKAASGKGILRITGRIKESDGSHTFVQHELRGTFVDGMLSGPGEKANYSYAADKSPISATNLLVGWFRNGVLSGQGKRVWIGPQSARPNAFALTADFTDGTPSGMTRMVRSQPYEGVVGDVVKLIHAPSGEVYIDQHQVQQGYAEGTLYFEREEWAMYIARWQDKRPVSAVLTRIPDYAKPADSNIVILSCNAWQLESAAWGCKEGQIRLTRPWSDISLISEKTDFTFSAQSAPERFKVKSNLPVNAFSTEQDGGRYTVRCNADWSECSGQALVPLIDPYVWRGEVSYRRGEVTPAGKGEILAHEKGKDSLERFAECRRFTSPTECADGKLFFNNGEFEGGYRFKDVVFGRNFASPISRYRIRDGVESIEIARHGWGTITWDNGRWARQRWENGELIDVGGCGDPRDGRALTCSLRGQTVMFNYPKRESRGRSESPKVWESEPTRERFVPIPVPSRPTYVLPGMR